MFQIVKCECGESGMLQGRCTGCKRARPSSEEVRVSLARNAEEREKLEKDLERALELEAEDES